MVKIRSKSLLWADHRKLYGEALGTKLKYFWMKAWNDIPESLAALPMIAATFVVGALLYNKIANDDTPTKYYSKITIFRPDNPRAARITTDETLKGEKAC